MADPTHVELIKRSDMFRGLDDAELERVAALGEVVSFGPDDVILEEDQRGQRCYFVVNGRVDIEIRAPFAGQSPQKLATVKRGDVFGELALVDGFLRSATCRAAEEVEALAFDNAKLEALLEEEPKIGFRVMKNIAGVLSARIRTTNMKLRNAISDAFYY